ncbi:MAG TPA: hypothetical protein VFW40_05805 [Capsulimonadaceae bacterium]|nr:hypothetical protein [Capsulimonadaceae bacterium]
MLRHEDLLYRLDVDKLLLGGTYANENILVRLLADSSIGGLWCARDDQQYCGKWRIDFALNDERMQPHQTELAPEYQKTSYQAGDVSISKRVFVPIVGDRPDMVFVIVEAHNAGKEPVKLGIFSEVKYPEVAWVQFVKHPDPTQRLKRVVTEQSPTLLISRTIGRDDEVRAIGGAVAIVEAHMDSQSASTIFEPIELLPQQAVTLPFAMAISPFGVEDALLTLAQIENHQEIFEKTQAEMRRLVTEHLQIATPDPLINRAIAWAKVNSYRQRTKYPSGYGFTNDPPQDVVVVRDAAWFVLGSDYFMPEFSRDMLELIQQFGVECGGKMTEFIRCCETPPYHYDYDLNINDDTPLYIIAAHHHYTATKNDAYLKNIYPTVRDAADWIIKQKFDGDLVYCTADEANVWGIASWRNIIPGYSINGAVTEINSECYRALVCAGEMAKKLGDHEKATDFFAEAKKLRAAINTKLVSEKTGYYLLNRDVQGVEHHDLTGDLVFPAMFNVADEGMQRRVLDLLWTPMFWTEHGSRTVAKGEPNYDPEFGVRLVGGIWPNLTVWVTYANRKLYPERLVEGMRAAYRICEVDNPKKFKNLVPGEFPECLHGENFESRGMALSPWMPPTYLWLAVEGLLGIEPTMDDIRVAPNLPQGWKWSAARCVPYCGRTFSLLVHEGTIYTTQEVETALPQEVYDEDISGLISCNTFILALRRDQETVVFVATDETRQVEITVPSSLGGGVAKQTLRFVLQAGEAQLLKLEKGRLAEPKESRATRELSKV